MADGMCAEAPAEEPPPVWHAVAFLFGVAFGAAIASAVWLRRRRGHLIRDAQRERQVIEVSELAGSLAHELRNPLSTIVLNLELLGEELRKAADVDSETCRRSLAKIESVRQQADRLQQLFEDFLRLIGPAQLQITDVDLNETVRRLLEFFGPQAVNAGIRIRAELAQDPLVCPLDARQIEQAILNLLLNAQDAMPDGGELTIRTHATEKNAVVEVIDTGVGIPAEHLGKIFRPFYSTKPAGTGLGLSTTHRIVTEHGSAIDVRSKPGSGTTFTVTVPLSEPTPPRGGP